MNQRPTYEALESRIEELQRQVNKYKSDAIKYQTLFNAFPHGITVSDESGNIVECNAAAEHLLGITKQEHEGRSIGGSEWRIIRPDGSDMPPNEWASVKALKENRPVEDCKMGIIRPNNTVCWMYLFRG